jgi:DNA-binding transcriptional ArsR family regulator
VETYESVLEALGDRTRRQIVASLRSGPASVGELAGRLPVSRPAISQHLRVLHQSRLVTFEEVGTRNLYRLDPAGLDELGTWLDGFWQNALDRFAEHVRDDSGGPKSRRRNMKKEGLDG